MIFLDKLPMEKGRESQAHEKRVVSQLKFMAINEPSPPSVS
jgi:hypothetical protein